MHQIRPFQIEIQCAKLEAVQPSNVRFWRKADIGRNARGIPRTKQHLIGCFSVSADRIRRAYRTTTGYPENLSSFGRRCPARRTRRGIRDPIVSLGHLSFWSARQPSARLSTNARLSLRGDRQTSRPSCSIRWVAVTPDIDARSDLASVLRFKGVFTATKCRIADLSSPPIFIGLALHCRRFQIFDLEPATHRLAQSQKGGRPIQRPRVYGRKRTAHDNGAAVAKQRSWESTVPKVTDISPLPQYFR